jgi:hypothetical protein
MNKTVSEEIKVEYYNLVENVEKLKKDINELDLYINTLNETNTQSLAPLEETPIELQAALPVETPATPSAETPFVPSLEIPTEAQPATEEIKEENKEELLEALTDTNEQQTKTTEQLLEEQKDEMLERRTNIEEALKKMAMDIKNKNISEDKSTAWKLLQKANIKLEEYISTILFYDIKRNWVTYGQQLWYRPEHYLNEFFKSYDELNINLERNKYYKDIMSKYIKKDSNNINQPADIVFIATKQYLDDTYSGIIQTHKRGGRKTKKQRNKVKQRKSKKQRKSRRIK